MQQPDPQVVTRPIFSETAGWFQKAVPQPGAKNFTTQLGVHFEEVREMVQELVGSDQETMNLLVNAEQALHALAQHLKKNEHSVSINNRVEYLDALCDQIVTATGCAHMAGMNIVSGLNEVNRSNFSKFDDNGEPIFDDNRKVMKSLNYSKADLSPFV
jgi:predicted HAD superfamily Cof-like phosphohydrolase